MRFTSTRDKKLSVSFEKAICDCMPPDGGLYVPSDVNDLRRWILFMDEKTTYASIAGALTLACVNEEFSPIICEAIATGAFPYEPKIQKLDDNLYTLELFHGPSGWHKDFGISYLTEALENILLMKNSKAIFLDVTTASLAPTLSNAIRGKKNIKAVLLFPKGQVHGLSENDLFWNGGNIYPVEIDGTVEDCHNIVKKIFAAHENVEKYKLTVANTANIGRLFPQSFFYPFAFSRLKAHVTGDIYYAMAPVNFSNVVAGLYSWKIAMPVTGFILPATDALTEDSMGQCTMLDSMIPIGERERSNPSEPSNIERLEEIFSADSLLMRNLVFPAKVTENDIVSAAKELFVKYHVFADHDTASAYAAILKKKQMICEDDGTVVLVMNDHPSLSSDFIRKCIGEVPAMPENVKASLAALELKKPCIDCTAAADSEIIKIIQSVYDSF